MHVPNIARRGFATFLVAIQAGFNVWMNIIAMHIPTNVQFASVMIIARGKSESVFILADVCIFKQTV